MAVLNFQSKISYKMYTGSLKMYVKYIFKFLWHPKPCAS